MSEAYAVEISDLKRAFGPVAAVDGLSLQAPQGRIYGLVGPDGAGKTTTLRILCGALLADSGMARVAGIDVRRRHLAGL